MALSGLVAAPKFGSIPPRTVDVTKIGYGRLLELVELLSTVILVELDMLVDFPLDVVCPGIFDLNEVVVATSVLVLNWVVLREVDNLKLTTVDCLLVDTVLNFFVVVVDPAILLFESGLFKIEILNS